MKRILVVAPHPDDELLGVGGMISKAIDNSDEVFICIVTRGVEPLFRSEDIETSRKEALAAHKYLGVQKTIFLDYPAVMLESVPRYKINQSILEVIQEVLPDEVYIPHEGDMQKDHTIVNEAAMVAVRPKYSHKVRAVYAYETLSETEWNIPCPHNAFIPNVYIDISNHIDRKIKALSFYQTQLSDFPQPRSIEAVQSLAKYRGSTIGVYAAEAFMLLRQIV